MDIDSNCACFQKAEPCPKTSKKSSASFQHSLKSRRSLAPPQTKFPSLHLRLDRSPQHWDYCGTGWPKAATVTHATSTTTQQGAQPYKLKNILNLCTMDAVARSLQSRGTNRRCLVRVLNNKIHNSQVKSRVSLDFKRF